MVWWGGGAQNLFELQNLERRGGKRADWRDGVRNSERNHPGLGDLIAESYIRYAFDLETRMMTTK